MFSLTELRGQSSLDKHGSIELSTSYTTARKPAWLVLLKLAVLAGLAAIGSAIVAPLLMHWLPAWKAALVTIGVLLIYIGAAFFVRPNFNADNMGWFGGTANDPFQYSDNVNRFLFQLHMFLGPGRFAAETMLDLCMLLGLARGPEVISEPEPEVVLADPSACLQADAEKSPLVTPGMRPDRFDVPPASSSRR